MGSSALKSCTDQCSQGVPSDASGPYYGETANSAAAAEPAASRDSRLGGIMQKLGIGGKPADAEAPAPTGAGHRYVADSTAGAIGAVPAPGEQKCATKQSNTALWLILGCG